MKWRGKRQSRIGEDARSSEIWIDFSAITRPIGYPLSDDLGTSKWPSASEIRSIMAVSAS